MTYNRFLSSLDDPKLDLPTAADHAERDLAATRRTPATNHAATDATTAAHSFPEHLRAHHCHCGQAFTRRRDRDTHQTTCKEPTP